MDKDLSDKLDILIKNTSPHRGLNKHWQSFSNGLFYALGVFFTTSFLIYLIVYILSKTPIYSYIQPYLKLK